MEKSIEQDSIIPLYHQLKEILKEKIESNFWTSDEKIPSEYELLTQYNVSRNTVKAAIDTLVQDGLLYRIQGKGTFVAKPKFEQSLSGFYSFSNVMKEKGMNPKDVIISINETFATPTEARQLQVEENCKLTELRRLRCANEEPIILETSYIPKFLVHHISQEEIEKTSLYDYMALKYGVVVTSAKEIFEPILIDDYESQYLDVKKGFPALLLDRIAYNSKGDPVEFCRSIVRGDRCRFYTELI